MRCKRDCGHDKVLFQPEGSAPARARSRWGKHETNKLAVLAGMGISLLSRQALTRALAHELLAILPVDGTAVMCS